jgi:hypothetical protein
MNKRTLTISIIALLAFITLHYGVKAASATDVPVFNFSVQSGAASGVSGNGNSQLQAQSGSGVVTSTYLIPTPHGVSANSNTVSGSWGNSGGYGGLTGYDAQAIGSSGVTGKLTLQPVQ